MMVLALDTSGPSLSAAVARDGVPLVEWTWPAPRPPATGGDEPLAVVQRILATAHVALDALNLVAVATGPGSFNGIRSGIATAEGLALALGVPAVGTPTLDALAYQHAGRAPVVALRAAGRGEYYAAHYAGGWDEWRRQGEYRVGPAGQVLADAPRGALVCGVWSDEVASLCAAQELALAPPVSSTPRASFVAALAALRLRDPAFDRVASLQPHYLRRPGITRPTHSAGRSAGLGERAAQGPAVR